jgi:putative phage-type endonuclease
MSLINELRNEIHNICEECLSSNIPLLLDEITQYTYDILINSNDYDSKNIYPEYIRQIIAELYSDKYGHYYHNFKITDMTHQVEYLKTVPQPTQRTEEWYKMKQNTIGASECAVIFGKNPYETLNSFIVKKCVNEENKNRSCQFTQHGIKYEPIIQQLYTKRTGQPLIEFGSITHPRINFISASPDGITPTGIMIEIKAPPKRVITGIPPIYYWYQMQQQLQVCKLKKVDFVECKIDEYESYTDFQNDTNNDKGVLIEYFIDDKINYIYPETILQLNEIDEWMLDVDNKIPEKGTFSRFIYWKLILYSSVEVWRDDVWWNQNIYKYYEIWSKVEYYRNNGYDELLPKKRNIKTKNKDEIIIDMNDNSD